MNVFVTGATGFVGSHLCARLKKTNKVVTLLRDFQPSPWKNWLKEALSGCVTVRGDILDGKLIRRIIADYDIQEVYHLAASAIVKTALKDPVTTFETNVVGTANLLEACRQIGDNITNVIMSTDKVYGDNKMDVSETEPLGTTIGIYEASKAAQDIVAQAYMDSYGLPIKIARCSNTYGYDLSPRIIPNTIRSCLRGDPPIIYEGQEETVRQYIYVEDVVSALTFLMNKASNSVWNVGTNDVLTQEEVVKKICSFFPLTPRYLKQDKPLKEIQRQSVNWQKIRQLGWKPQHSFEEGIQKTIKKFEKFGF